MADKSAIQWTDATWNPTTGCTKVSPGCANCYIERTPAFRIHGRKFVKGATDLRLHADRLDQPLHWRKPRRVFVNSLSDLFHPDVPDAFIDRVFAVMALCPQHTFQVLTKRPERMYEYMTAPVGYSLRRGGRIWTLANDLRTDQRFRGGSLRNNRGGRTWPLPNVWHGVSVENRRWKSRIDDLRATPALVHFLSIEPLLEDIGELDLRGIQWVIVGGESGPEARPFDVAWARSIVAQCKAAGVACFVKQLGKWPVSHQNENEHGGRYWVRLYEKDGTATNEFGCEAHGKKGDPAEWPEDLRIREFPEVTR